MKKREGAKRARRALGKTGKTPEGPKKALKGVRQSRAGALKTEGDEKRGQTVEAKEITLRGVREGNLQNIDLTIPRGKLVVLTGLSGSGKTTLAMDVIYEECQRQYLEAIGYQGVAGPKLTSMRGASPAVRITQGGQGRNPRSTVGTMTSIYTELRMVYEKLHERACPACGAPIIAADCREETEKKGSDFFVYQYCPHCGAKMEKLTRTDFSHNTREGACPTCQGLGKALQLDMGALVDEEKSLEGGAVEIWKGRYLEYICDVVRGGCAHFGCPLEPGTPIKAYGPVQRALLFKGAESEEVKALTGGQKPPKAVMDGRFEGLEPLLWRRLAAQEGEVGKLAPYFTQGPCPDCHGERLAPMGRSVTVTGTRLPELSAMPLGRLREWVKALDGKLTEAHRLQVEVYLTDLLAKLRRLANVGLGYLTLDRQAVTLSGGESQRIKLAAALDSELTGILYILDEPTVGLHPKDTAGILQVLKALRDKGNTVILIEHDVDVMEAADYIVDIGPGSGRAGGRIVGKGSLAELMAQPDSVTGRYLKGRHEGKKDYRPGDGGAIELQNVWKYNLQGVDVHIPTGELVAVTGVSGSGKSTLVLEVLAKGDARGRDGKNKVLGLDGFDQVITIEQAAPTRMNRSNVATYTGAFGDIRALFAALPKAKEKGLTPKHFSFNTPGGRCEACQGLGKVVSNLLFFEDMEVPCPVCGGKRFSETVLAVEYEGKNITEILDATVEEALPLFAHRPKLRRILELLCEVGLGYLALGQSVTTLSGGEAQRLMLARELLGSRGKRGLYLIDEPTTGLHPLDVAQFLKLLDRLVEEGNTVVVVEHNLQLIAHADWVLEMGPGGGDEGGKLIATGTPKEVGRDPRSITGRYL